MAKSFKFKAINAVITAIVRTLFGWAQEWGEDAFFLLVIGDKRTTDVAWYNTEDLAYNGAIALADCAETAGAYQDLATSVDLLIQDKLEEPEFKKKYEMTTPEKNDHGWYSLDFDNKEKTKANS